MIFAGMTRGHTYLLAWPGVTQQGTPLGLIWNFRLFYLGKLFIRPLRQWRKTFFKNWLLVWTL